MSEGWIVYYLTCLIVGLIIRRRMIYAKKYPKPDKLPRINGMIEHPIYGRYPEKVDFKPGMTLYPGQTAVFKFVRAPESSGE